eukprot:TRINITY_DN350_c0_g3_i1.p1 TRINITY_DN350_c0_g3~~TRINITY_DN350_c0_g3_i1.p1  ORF type:complete len:1270 (+),score=401.91 TRINITY_DN350_c0_g3_i1:33-3842(+)
MSTSSRGSPRSGGTPRSGRASWAGTNSRANSAARLMAQLKQQRDGVLSDSSSEEEPPKIQEPRAVPPRLTKHERRKSTRELKKTEKEEKKRVKEEKKRAKKIRKEGSISGISRSSTLERSSSSSKPKVSIQASDSTPPQEQDQAVSDAGDSESNDREVIIGKDGFGRDIKKKYSELTDEEREVYDGKNAPGSVFIPPLDAGTDATAESDSSADSDLDPSMEAVTKSEAPISAEASKNDEDTPVSEATPLVVPPAEASDAVEAESVSVNDGSADTVETKLPTIVTEDTSVALLEQIRELKGENQKLKSQIRQKDAVISSLQQKLGMLMAANEPDAHPSKKGKKGKEQVFKLETLKLLRHNKRVAMMDQEESFGHRERLVLEVMTTEQSYVTGLEILCQIYLNKFLEAAKDSGGKINEEDVKTIFGNIETLRIINQNLLKDLEERLDQWYDEGMDKIGDILTKWAPQMKPYSRFGGHFNESLEKIEEMKSNSVWRKTLEELDESVGQLDGLALQAYFIMPVQRLPRYVLLIRDLLKKTPPEHQDFKALEEAAVEMGRAADTLNEKIREAESNVHFFQITDRKNGFDRLITHPKQFRGARLWIREDSVKALFNVREDRLYSGKKKLELISFNDILVFSPLVSKKAPPQDYHIPTALCYARIATVKLLQRYELDVELFSTAVVVYGPQNQWVIAFANMGMLNNWLKDLESVMQLRPGLDATEGIREGKYEFKNDSVGVYDGEWCNNFLHGKGTLIVGKTIYDGYWDEKYRAGFGYIDGGKFKETKTVGWKFTPDNQVKVVDEHGLWEEGELTDRDWQLILTGAHKVQKSKDERFIEQGRQNLSLFRVESGKIRVEKSTTPGGPKKVLVKLGPGTVLGDTSVIPSMKAATADVLADEPVTLKAISINILFGLFRGNPGLSMRFYRQMARKLATQLRSLHSKKAPPPTDDEESESDEEGVVKKQIQEVKPKEEEGVKMDAETLELLKKFELPLTENLIISCECSLKGILKKVGVLHVFSNNICFESNVFGSSNKDVFLLEDITDLAVDKKGLRLTCNKKKHQYINVKNLTAFKAMVVPLWAEALNNPTKVPTKKSKKAKLKKTATQSAARAEKSEAVTMLQEDWELLIDGAKSHHYHAGDYIIKEGMEHLRIYQIATGRAAIKKNTPNGEILLGHLEANSLFGEMTFLEKGEATASIIAEGPCQVYIIEGYFINILFVNHPALAGRFYSYLATILAQRLSDRELQIQREYAEAKAKRRAARKERLALTNSNDSKE